MNNKKIYHKNLLSPWKVGENGNEVERPLNQHSTKITLQKNGKGKGREREGGLGEEEEPTNKKKSTTPPTGRQPSRQQSQQPKRSRTQPPAQPTVQEAIEVHEAQGSVKIDEQDAHKVDNEGTSTKGIKRKPSPFEKKHPQTLQTP